MESIACIAGGICLVACGIALFRLRPPNWKNDGELVDLVNIKAIEWWSTVQRLVRVANNSLMIFIGIAIASTAFIPHGAQATRDSGRAWMLAWGVILVLLLFCILFAMIDAFSSLAGYRRALPEAARRSFTVAGESAAVGEQEL